MRLGDPPSAPGKRRTPWTIDTLDEQKRAIYEIAEAIAPTWERRRADIEEVATPVREWMLRELVPRGRHGPRACRRGGRHRVRGRQIIGESGRLITSDFSPAMLDAARRRGAELGLANVDYRVIDAERIELDDDSVDGVLCRFGYMLMPDPVRRSPRPAASCARAVGWRSPSGARWSGTRGSRSAGISLVQRGHIPPPEPPPAPGPFSMASPERLEALLRDAGFAEVRIEEVHGSVRHRTPTSTWA